MPGRWLRGRAGNGHRHNVCTCPYRTLPADAPPTYPHRSKGYNRPTMSRYAKSIDVTSSAELRRLAEQVKQTRAPVELTRDDEVLAVVRPAPASRSRRAPTQADDEAFRSAAGAWQGIVEVEKFKEENRRQKLVSTRPPVQL